MHPKISLEFDFRKFFEIPWENTPNINWEIPPKFTSESLASGLEIPADEFLKDF